MIFDSNTLIFISKNTLKVENILLPGTQPKISVVSYIEALGYPFKNSEEELYLQKICEACEMVYLSDPIIIETIKLRKKHKIKLPDAIIYATALVEKLPLLTNNTDDFTRLGGKVKLIDPFNL